jgi:uncharacterized protein (DUF1778 family)
MSIVKIDEIDVVAFTEALDMPIVPIEKLKLITKHS